MSFAIGRPRTLAREIGGSACDVLRACGFPADDRTEKVIVELAESELAQAVAASPWVAAAVEALRLWLMRRTDGGLEEAFVSAGDCGRAGGGGGDRVDAAPDEA